MLGNLSGNGIGVSRAANLGLCRLGLVRAGFLARCLCPRRGTAARLGEGIRIAAERCRDGTLERLGSGRLRSRSGSLCGSSRCLGGNLLCNRLVRRLNFLGYRRLFIEGGGNHFPGQIARARLALLLLLRAFLEMNARSGNLVFRQKTAALNQTGRYIGNGNLVGNRLAGKRSDRSLCGSKGFLRRHIVHLVGYLGAFRYQTRRTGSLFAVDNAGLIRSLVHQLFLAYQAVANLARNLQHHRYAGCVVVGRLIVGRHDMEHRTHDGKDEQYRADNQAERDNGRKRARIAREHGGAEQEKNSRYRQGHGTCLLHDRQELDERRLFLLQRLRAVVIGHQDYLAAARG